MAHRHALGLRIEARMLYYRTADLAINAPGDGHRPHLRLRGQTRATHGSGRRPDRRIPAPICPKGATVDANSCPKDERRRRRARRPRQVPEHAQGLHGRRQAAARPTAGRRRRLRRLDTVPGRPRAPRVDATGCPKDSDGDGVLDEPRPGAPTLRPRAPRSDAEAVPSDADNDGVPRWNRPVPGHLARAQGGRRRVARSR